MALLAVADLDAKTVRTGKTTRADKNEVLIVSLDGKNATALVAECVGGVLTINVADRRFKVWRVTARGRELALEGNGPGNEPWGEPGETYEVTIEPKDGR